MIARVLPQEEWSKLDVTGFAQIAPTLRPEDVEVIVVEDGDRIVSSMVAMRVVHLESLWIDPAYRGHPTLARKLLRQAIASVKKWAASWVLGCSDTDHMDDIIKRVGGQRLSVDSYMIPLGGN